jgi:hypothetical protein
MMRQNNEKAQRRGQMSLPAGRHADPFSMVGKPLPTSFQAGYPPKMLQEIMGHASITTTLDLYGHLYLGETDRYADRLDQAATNGNAAKMRPDDRSDGSVTT